MGDYYHQFLTSMSGAGGLPMLSPEDFQFAARPGSGMPMIPGVMPVQYQNVGYFPGFEEPLLLDNPKDGKRRKSGAGMSSAVDHVKHRRTRSGCFMCRSRRVKCDETRPVCERCRKGNRECIYPEPPSSKTNKSKDPSSTAQSSSPLSIKAEDDDFLSQSKPLETIPDDEEPEEKHPGSATSASWKFGLTPTSGRFDGSESPHQDENKSSSPSESTHTSSSITTGAMQLSDFNIPAVNRADWSHLPADYRFYLDWFVENMTHHHYCMSQDPDDFFKTMLPTMALRDDALLNAVVGFSAYHHTLQNPTGKLQDFLKYYNQSVRFLLGFLKKKERQTLSTLLTVMQLAATEEYLGDWVNLMGHQKAAFEILTKMFSPSSLMQVPVGRMLMTWYGRYDNFVALMGGFPTDLPRDYFNAAIHFYHEQVAANPDVIRWKIDERNARFRMLSYDMSMLFAKGSRGQITPSKFNEEHDRLTERLVSWKASWDPALTDPKYLANDFPPDKEPPPDDIVNPYTTGLIYKGPLLSNTMITAEYHSLMVMHKSQASNIPPAELYAELGKHSYLTCSYFEALEFSPSAPKATLVLVQACIAIAALFLPQDERHFMWTRRKFALIESLGYMHPISLRTKMAEVFRDPSCVRWWLPNDEGFTPVLQSIRSFADERNAVAVSAQAENLREVKHIFAKLALSDEAAAAAAAEASVSAMTLDE